MMSIVFLAPDAEMAEMARKVLDEFGDEVFVAEGLLSQSLEVARELEAKGADVFVSRGGTALFLKSAGIRTPVVELPVTGQDMARALEKARQLAGRSRPRIGVVAFSNMMLDLEAFAPLLDMDLCCISVESENDVEAAIERALAAGAEVLLGGVITTRVASERGIPAVLLRSGEAAFLQAFREARSVAHARRLEKQKAEAFKAILDYAYEGIVSVDRHGEITVFNPAAERLTGVSSCYAVGRKLDRVIPELNLAETLASGQEQLGDLIDLGRSKFLASRVPIKVNGEVVGAIATFQDVTRIQQMEAKVRREIYSKGHVAKFSFRDIMGESEVIKQAIRTAKDYAHTDSAVLIIGETGVGKELFAQSIHQESRRKNGPFVAVNCAALPESLLESELFGYVEGAFTGANPKGKPGLFELAHGGTIFLDEVSEIPLRLQGRLLRILQEREVMRLGHDRVIPVDVRVICATNRDLREMVNQGLFRADLYWRLNVLLLKVPPLRERKDDLPILVSYFLSKFSRTFGSRVTFTEGAMSELYRYGWPGNVRELENFCERVAVLEHGREVDSDFVRRALDPLDAPSCDEARCTELVSGKPIPLPGDIYRVLKEAGGSKTRAAEILGIHRTTLWRRLKKLEKGVGRELN